MPDRPAVSVSGFADPRFERVREAFAANFAQHSDVGAACCVYWRGEPVVDLYGGIADARSGAPWGEDTAVLVFSTTKGVTAMCVNLLIERGVLDPDAPVARYWPEFAANGKHAIPVRWLLSHQAGLPAVEGDFTLEQILAVQPLVEALAAQAPAWEPGSDHGYHARSYGWLAGELVRRVTGRSLGRFLRDEIADPLDLDLWVGLPEKEEPRVARLIPPEATADPERRALEERFMGPDTLLGKVLSGPSNRLRYDESWNTRGLHATEMPSSNGICTARALARLYAAVIGPLDGSARTPLLRPETLARACAVETSGPDRVILIPTAFGIGFMLPPSLAQAARPGSFGHPGAGGSLGYADPAAGIALGYVMNRMDMGLTGDPRSRSLLEAAYASIES